MSEETLILAERPHQAVQRRRAAGHRSSLCAHRSGRSHRRCRPRRRRQDDLAAPVRGLAAAQRRTAHRLRRRHPNRTGRDPAAGQLHAAAFRALRGPVGPAKPEPLRRPAERRRRRAPGCLRAAAGLHRSRAVYRPARRCALRRHEAEARPGLRLDPGPPSLACSTSPASASTRSRAASSGRWSMTSWIRASASSGARLTSTRPSAAPRCSCSTRERSSMRDRPGS